MFGFADIVEDLFFIHSFLKNSKSSALSRAPSDRGRRLPIIMRPKLQKQSA
jgi:hypothetical protein